MSDFFNAIRPSFLEVTSSSYSVCGKDSEEPIQDSLFYLHSTFVYFLVEVCQQIFKLISKICTSGRTASVHIQSHPFEAHSKYFTTEFKLPKSPLDDIAGTSHQSSIVIKQVIKKGFQNFLNAVYPLYVSLTYLDK